MGTSAFAVPTLRALVASSHNVVSVYTQPPRPSGRRGLKIIPSALHQVASELDIEILIPTCFEQEEYEKFLNFNADVAIVVSYGLIIPSNILSATRLGFYNGHASLLPRWRGAAPIQRAIMSNDNETGIAIMKMDENLDMGPVAIMKNIEISPNITAGLLHDKLSIMCADAMLEAMDKLEQNNLPLSPQKEDGVTYAKKISKSETRIDFKKSSEEVHNHIRALSPFPGAWFEISIKNRFERIKLLESELVDGEGYPGEIISSDFTIACAKGAVRIKRLQRAGGHAITSVKDFLLGNPILTGSIID
ncbi:Methionyl-tRNA formyltransferase [Candidatus Liberibacter americanus str. Sao Paulo]|uniref:Methionyl-tRNA formyltransferase n=2 Tax=Candidatus Liberibacter americanus TaxID=309868 RepID=U6B8Q1_9HYPH|nr:Methionyl-tRNA formyltransferase [Candidatus Liberibacter americanus str. Sao Paulo]EMS36265.1 methionyl-tRNA formyltransferase [Candidatus Liberibacter americanus PW_SP]